MNKRILLLLSSLVFFTLQPSIASAELKVGFFNFGKIIKSVPQTQAAEKKLQDEFEPKQKEVTKLSNKVKAMKEDLEKNSVVLSEADLLKKQRDIRAQEREFKLMVQDLNDDFSIRRNQEMQAIQKLVYEEAMSIAQKDSLDLLLHNGVLYASGKIDITDKILKNLSSK